MRKLKFLPAGDCAIMVELGREIDREINGQIRRMVLTLKEKKLEGIWDILPTYRSVLINYDPLVYTFDELKKLIEGIEFEESDELADTLRLIEIPTVYGDEFGPDLANVANHAGLSSDEVVRIHAGTDYLVYMMGFAPGFTYLGGLDERIATPRLETPRLKIPAGSVGIAGSQTGMYPSVSPGGWQLIGRTPINLYDDRRDPPVFIQAGDYIRYVPIEKDEFYAIDEQIREGRYEVKISQVNRGELHE